MRGRLIKNMVFGWRHHFCGCDQSGCRAWVCIPWLASQKCRAEGWPGGWSLPESRWVFLVRFVECHKLQFIEGVCALKEFAEARVLANNLWPRVVLTCENRRYAQSGTLTAQRHPQPRVSSLCHATRALEEARTHTHGNSLVITKYSDNAGHASCLSCLSGPSGLSGLLCLSDTRTTTKDQEAPSGFTLQSHSTSYNWSRPRRPADRLQNEFITRGSIEWKEIHAVVQGS